MYTQCPHCASVFAIDAEQLTQAAGRVQCGACEREFDALASLRRGERNEASPPRLDPEQAAIQGDLFYQRPPESTQPSFARMPEPLGGNARWWLTALALALLLAGQIVAVQRDDWASDARWRPAYLALCARIGCTLPPWREPERFALVAREIGPHPSVPDALLVTASLRNDAAFAQPLPVLELSLADLDGRVVALRRFQPDEYTREDSEPMLAPGQTASARLEIADPGKAALAFTFEFR